MSYPICMFCPVCGRTCCDHSPAERDESLLDRFRDRFVGLEADGERVPESNEEKAARLIEKDGADGYASAARLVGADRADELLTTLVRRNMASEGHTPKRGEVEEIVAKTRAKKGF